jgi:hypothetical protein
MRPREKLLTATARRYLDLTGVPNLGDWRFQSLTDAERVAYEDAIFQYDKKGKLLKEIYSRGKRLLIARTSVDADNKLLFTDDDVDQLAAVDGAIIGLLFDAAAKHCGIGKTDFEGLVKNSAGGAVAASP